MRKPQTAPRTPEVQFPQSRFAIATHPRCSGLPNTVLRKTHTQRSTKCFLWTGAQILPSYLFLSKPSRPGVFLLLNSNHILFKRSEALVPHFLQDRFRRRARFGVFILVSQFPVADDSLPTYMYAVLGLIKHGAFAVASIDITFSTGMGARNAVTPRRRHSVL